LSSPAHEAVAWLDPRRWSALARAHGLFLAFVTLVEFGALVKVVLGPWLPTPRLADELDLPLALAYLALFLLPFVSSQVLTGLWLHRNLRAGDRLEAGVKRIAREALVTAGTPGAGFRRPTVCAGRVRQPAVVSVCGLPFLILPATGLALYRHFLGPQAEAAFRAAVAHEAGHLEAGDDVLFVPWLAYMSTLAALLAFGLFQVSQGLLSGVTVASHLLAVGLLIPLGMYAIRRREAYADSVAVTALGSTVPILAALKTLPSHGQGWFTWLASHFSAARRSQWIAGAGVPFLTLSRLDVSIVALIYFTAGANPFSLAASGGGGLQFEAAMWVREMVGYVLITLFVLTLCGASIARRGNALPVRDVVLASVVCIVGKQLQELLQRGTFSLSQVGYLALSSCGMFVLGGLLFVGMTRLINRWTVCIVGRPGGDVQARLVSAAALLTATFAILASLAQTIAMGMMGRIGTEGAERLAKAPVEEQIAAFAPILFTVGALWLLQAVAAVGLIAWTLLKSRGLPPVPCSECGEGNSARAEERLVVTCSRCHSLLRKDMFLSVEA
jgi:hypothetical protein